MVLLLPLPLAPLVSALEAPPHPPFLHLWRLCLQFPLFSRLKTHPNQPLTFTLFKHFHLLLHSLDASSPPPAQTYPSSEALSRSSGWWHHLLPITRMCRRGSHNWQGLKHEESVQRKPEILPLPSLQFMKPNKTAAHKWVDINPSSRYRNFLSLGPDLEPASTSPSKPRTTLLDLYPIKGQKCSRSSSKMPHPSLLPGRSPTMAPVCFAPSIPAVPMVLRHRQPAAARQQPCTSGEKGNSVPATPGPTWAGLGNFYPKTTEKHGPQWHMS